MLTVEPNWAAFFTGESMTLTCDMREGEYSDWYYALIKDNREYFSYSTHRIFFLEQLTPDMSGQYYCRGSHINTPRTKESNTVSLTVSGEYRSAGHLQVVLVATHGKRK